MFFCQPKEGQSAWILLITDVDSAINQITLTSQKLVGWLVFILRPGQQFFSHVLTGPPLPGYLPVLWVA